MKLLFVNACVRPQSRTLELARYLLRQLPTEVTEVRLDALALQPLTKDSLEHREQLMAQGNWEDPSFFHAQQFAQADCIVIAAPYWDFGFPALLKIYLERISVAGITFCYEAGRPKGLCNGKRLYYITTSGGPILNDFGYSYVKSLAKSLYGIDDTVCFCAENLDIEGVDLEKILDSTKQEIKARIHAISS